MDRLELNKDFSKISLDELIDICNNNEKIYSQSEIDIAFHELEIRSKNYFIDNQFDELISFYKSNTYKSIKKIQKSISFISTANEYDLIRKLVNNSVESGYFGYFQYGNEHYPSDYNYNKIVDLCYNAPEYLRQLNWNMRAIPSIPSKSPISFETSNFLFFINPIDVYLDSVYVPKIAFNLKSDINVLLVCKSHLKKLLILPIYFEFLLYFLLFNQTKIKPALIIYFDFFTENNQLIINEFENFLFKIYKIGLKPIKIDYIFNFENEINTVNLNHLIDKVALLNNF